MACPFVSKEVLARLPEEKRKELECYYSQMNASKKQICPIDTIINDEEKLGGPHVSDRIPAGMGGACPFISSTLTDPSYDTFEAGHNLNYNCKYSNYLNQRYLAPPNNLTTQADPLQSNDQLFDNINRPTSQDEDFKPLILKELYLRQRKIRSYPQILLNTLFHEHDKYDEYRKIEFSKMFFFADEVKLKGNEAYKKDDLYLALDYYEHILTLYNWLEIKNKQGPFTLFGKEIIQITDDVVENKLKQLDTGITDELLETDNLLTVIINVFQNAFICYMKLFHFKEAKKCAQYIIHLKDDYAKGYYFLGQAVYFNNDATYQQIQETLSQIKKQSQRVIRQDEISLLFKIEELLTMKLNNKVKTDVTLICGLLERAQKIYDYKLKNGLELIPSTNLNNGEERLLIARKMHQKYSDVLEYFRESALPKDVFKTIQEFLKFDGTYQQMKHLSKLNFRALQQEVLLELPESVVQQIKENQLLVDIANELRVKQINNIFMESKHVNIELMQYAIKLCNKEELRRKKKEERLRKLKAQSLTGYILGGNQHIVWNALAFGVIILLWTLLKDDLPKYLAFSN